MNVGKHLIRMHELPEALGIDSVETCRFTR
jgi:hypothetical protein